MKRFWIIIIILLPAYIPLPAQVPEAYLRMAAENNPSLRAGFLEFEAALQRIPQAKSLSDPNIMIGYRAWPSGAMPGMEKAVFSLSQMFPWFGTLKASGDRAALQAEAEYQNFIRLRNDLFFQLSAAWFPIYELQKIRDIEQKNLSLLQSYKNIATRNFENGTAPMVDVLRADIIIKEAETRLSILEQQETALMAVFNNIVGQHVDTPVDIPDTLIINNQINLYNQDSLLAQNPVIRELEYRLEASELSRELAQKQGMPAISVGIEYMYMGNGQGMSSGSHKKGALMPMVGISLPIYRSTYKAAREEARLLQESIAAQKESALNQLFSEHRRSVSMIRQQEQLLDLYDQQITITRQSLNLLISSYSSTGNNFDEVLRMQQQQLEYEKQKATAITELYTARAQIDYLTAKMLYNDENR